MSDGSPVPAFITLTNGNRLEVAPTNDLDEGSYTLRITAQDDNSSADLAGVKTYYEDIVVVVENPPYENCFVG